ncbi:MAG: flagellar basal body rod protein FlgB [Bacilli bacterium]
MSTLDSLYMTSLQSALGAGQLRQQVYANNIANANTPGYKREVVHFNSLLQAQLAAVGLNAPSGLPMLANTTRDLGGVTQFSNVNPVVATDTATQVGGNGNNVNIDAEMSALAQNQISYGALVQDLQDQFATMRTAITG